MNVEFREATTEDIAEICSVNRLSIKGLADPSYSEEQVSAWIGGVSPDLYPIESAETYFLLAERNDEIIGFGWVKSDADDYFRASVDGEITGLYVHPSVAGTGVGSRLYDRLETFAREQNVDSLGLWASLNALAFYESHGYTRVIEQTLEYEGGTTVPVVEMCRRLD